MSKIKLKCKILMVKHVWCFFSSSIVLVGMCLHSFYEKMKIVSIDTQQSLVYFVFTYMLSKKFILLVLFNPFSCHIHF